MLRNSFNLNYLLKSLFPNTIALGLRASTCDFREFIIQSIAMVKLILTKYLIKISLCYHYRSTKDIP